jgi:DNA-binding LacI/PurR family transcriptional regulator
MPENPNPDSTGRKLSHKVAHRRRRQPTDRATRLADVARMAGVSTASASRALAHPELVSDAVRDRVSDAASQLGYVANAAARSLSTRKSGLVGIVLGEPDPTALHMLEAAEKTLSAGGTGVLLRLASRAISATACAQALVARGVDGLLYVGSGEAPDAADWQPARPLPYIACGQGPAADAAGNRGTIERRGLALAYAYLQQLGHRRIGVIGGHPDEGAADAALDIATINHPMDNLEDLDAARAGARRLIEKAATAIVARSDTAAAAALLECRVLGLAVPQQMSVVGWGDTALARCLDPPLTSVRIPAHAGGGAAAEYLLAAMAGRDVQWPSLTLKLVIRGSTGPLPV